jgi:hypothetical protein
LEVEAIGLRRHDGSQDARPPAHTTDPLHDLVRLPGHRADGYDHEPMKTVSPGAFKTIPSHEHMSGRFRQLRR